MFICTTSNSNLQWNNETSQCECKNYQKCKIEYSWNPSKCICDNSKYLKSIDDTSVIKCDKIMTYGYCVNKNDRYYSNSCNKKFSK